MKKLFIYTLLIYLFFNITVSAKDNFFDAAKHMYDKKKLEMLNEINSYIEEMEKVYQKVS